MTTDCYFLMGLSVTDAWKLADYHAIINFGKRQSNEHQKVCRHCWESIG